MNQWRQRQLAKRVQAGDGRPLRPFRWWEQMGRALFLICLPDHTGGPIDYAIDVRHWGNQSGGDVRANLYRNGSLAARSKLPAVFPVPGGVIEVAMTPVGIKRSHFVADDGTERQLIPDPRSAEGRRARLDADHPGLSRLIGAISVLLLVIGVVLLALQLAATLTAVPEIAAHVGRFESPVHLPAWLNIALGIGAGLGSAERALRLRYSWLDRIGN